MSTKISFITFTRNSKRRLKLLLENIKDVVDEIIIVDGFSSDDTVEIARSYGAKVFGESLGVMWSLIGCLL
jgi:glycosyltransferase involved in cell wall biosynthesis